VRSSIWLILVGLLLGGSGCAYQPSFGEPVDDDARRAALLRAYPRPEVSQVVFRTLIRWGKREVSLTEVVKASGDGGLAAAGVTDIGSTLYAARIDPNGQGRIISKSLPVSDPWLLDGLIAELLIPWNRPEGTCRLHRQADDAWALVCREQRITRVFLYDEAGHWRQFQRVKGSRVLSRTVLEWDDQPIPKIMRVDNATRHYHVVRERVSVQ
jgi:hypothetical protein